MYARQITSEEVRRIINAKRKAKREEFLYKAKQKILGLLAITMSIASPVLLDGDATASLLFLPLGIYVLFTKKECD